MWVATILIHSLIFSYLNFFIPLSDTLIFSVLGNLIGSFLRAHHDQRLKIKTYLNQKTQTKLNQIQGRFLSFFFEGLVNINQKTLAILQPEDLLKPLQNLKGQNILQTTLKSCLELDDYLKGILSYTDLLNEKKLLISKTNFPIKPLLEKIKNQFSQALLEKKMEIYIFCPEEYEAYTDQTICSQILVNFYSNAIKYSPNKSVIYIHVHKSFKEYEISVTDQGKGIAKDQHDKIFEKFYRVQNDEVYKVKGLGLGLYLCKFFAFQIQSKIKLKSTISKGSTFSLTLKKAKK
jgi:K+-sensing histidine kinase KdpD